MEIVRTGQDMSEPSNNQLFDGDAYLQSLVGRDQLRVNEVTFGPAARTKWHTHSFEQVLIVTAGSGIVATEENERRVTPGDVVLFAAGERHWHGAQPDQAMTHISVNGPGETQW